MSALCAVCGQPASPDHRLFRLPMALQDLGLGMEERGPWAAASCVNRAAELKRKSDTRNSRAPMRRGWRTKLERPK